MRDNINFSFQEYYERIVTRSRGFSGPYRFNSLDELRDNKDIIHLKIEQVIGKAILDFEEKNPSIKSKLRADAKVLLVINFSDMIYYPLSKADSQNRYELKIEIYNEVQMILEEFVAKNDDEISSHKVLEVGLQLWGKLKTLNEGSW